MFHPLPQVQRDFSFVASLVFLLSFPPAQTHLQLQEESPALLPLVDSVKKLFVKLVMLLQALDLGIVQTQQLLGIIL